MQTDNNSTAAPGTVVKQDPTAGTKAASSAARSRSSCRPAGTSCRTSINENYQVALGQLNNAGFTNIQRVTVTNPQLANGTVVLQNPKAGQRVPASTQITLSVVQNAASPSPTPTTPSPTPTSPTPVADRHLAEPAVSGGPIWSPLTGATVPGSN